MLLTKHGFAVLETDQFISKWAKESGRLDHDQSAWPRVLPYVKRGDVVIDAGAYIGDTALPFAKMGCRVYAFEPNIKAYECLVHNMKNYENVVTYNEALSHSRDRMSYAVDYNIDNVGASRMKAHDMGRKAMTIDMLDLNRCELIKIDCEGFELSILQGASNTIRKFYPILVLEINEGALKDLGTSPLDIFEWLDAEGYSYRNIYEGQPMDGLQYDIICFKRSKNENDQN